MPNGWKESLWLVSRLVEFVYFVAKYVAVIYRQREEVQEQLIDCGFSSAMM